MKSYIISYKLYINDTNIGVGTIEVSTKKFNLDDTIKKIQDLDKQYKDKCVVITFMLEV